MKGNRIFLCLLFLLFYISKIEAAKVDTLNVYSSSMNKNVETVVITPSRQGNYPVIYLLHGYSGNAKSWIELKPELLATADEKGIIFVCPDGKNSWYWDSPLNSVYRYETFVSKELVNYIDANYPTINDRKKRAISGLSMGGHGAMWLSFRNKETFGAAGSMSGGLDIRPFPDNWEMARQLGSLAGNKSVWDEHTVINQINKIRNGELALIIDCGYGDFFFKVNNAFHEKLVENKIDHDYLVRPGVHNGEYWRNALDYQLLFFEKFFNK